MGSLEKDLDVVVGLDLGQMEDFEKTSLYFVLGHSKERPRE
jgi:hypothetical protein